MNDTGSWTPELDAVLFGSGLEEVEHFFVADDGALSIGETRQHT